MSDDLIKSPTAIDGLLVASVKAAGDERGTVREFFRGSAWPEIPDLTWRQINLTETGRGAVFSSALTAAGVAHVNNRRPCGLHWWTTWRPDLNTFRAPGIHSVARRELIAPVVSSPG